MGVFFWVGGWRGVKRKTDGHVIFGGSVVQQPLPLKRQMVTTTNTSGSSNKTINFANLLQESLSPYLLLSPAPSPKKVYICKKKIRFFKFIREKYSFEKKNLFSGVRMQTRDSLSLPLLFTHKRRYSIWMGYRLSIRKGEFLLSLEVGEGNKHQRECQCVCVKAKSWDINTARFFFSSWREPRKL